MNLRKNFDEIDKYFSGEMSPEEKEVFEIRLKEDKELKVNVSEYNDIKKAIKHRDTLKFVSMAMEDLEKRQQSPVRRLVSNPAIRAAAIIVVLLGLAFVIYWMVNKQDQDTKTLAFYFTPEQIDYTFRGENDDIDQILTRGSKLFNGERYQEALEQFSIVVDQDPGHIQAKYYLGLTNLYAEKYSLALPLLLEVAQSGDMNYSSGAKWHLCWNYIKTGEKLKALELLQELKSNDYYKDEAEKVMELLEGE